MIGIISVGAAAGAILALLGWLSFRMFRAGTLWFDHPAVFFLLVFTAILALRLPQIRSLREINVDESQLVAQASRYLSHPVPWRDVDGTTSGPLDSWLLSAPNLFGAPASWATARTMLWTAQCATLFFIYLALRCFGTRVEAQFSLLPTILLYALARDHDSTHYSSETLPVLLLSIMAWLLCRAWLTEKFSNPGLFSTGFLAGCVPFAKLQASPMAAYLFAAGLAQVFWLHRKYFWRKTGLMCAGAMVFPVILLTVVIACGAGDDFWKSYILGPGAYAHETLGTKVVALWALLARGKDFGSYFVSAVAGGILLAAAWAHVREPKPGTKLFGALIATIGLGVVGGGCLLMPGKGFGHYLLLLIPAQSVFFGLALVIGKTLLLSEKTGPNVFPKPIHLFMAAFVAAISLQVIKTPGYFGDARELLARRSSEKKSFVARRVLKASRPGDTLSVWGWMPSYYVETGLIPATRDAIGHFIIEAGPYRDYYQRRYLSDLERSWPAVFIDAMADGVFHWLWTRLNSRQHESFPELAKFVDENYSLWLTVHISTPEGPGLPIRIYVLKSRVAELNLKPEELNISEDASLAPE